jgi:hypothetical protein
MDIGLYLHRILFLTMMSVINSLLAVPDWLWYHQRARDQPLHQEPLFILGHPRTGTTHIHNLLSLDSTFAFATTFHAGFPSSFICLERFKGLLAPLLSPTRPMDRMKLDWDLPAEDEIATTLLSGGTSPYTALVLPREEKALFRSFFTFKGSDTSSSCPSNLVCHFKEWQRSFLYFLRKITLRHCLMNRQSEPSPLLIKSPVHSARIPLLLAMFPRARFVFMHRDPYEVFQSAANMATSYYGHCYLQKPEDEHLDQFILDQYKVLMSQYLATRNMVEPDRLFELSFSDLEADPIGSLKAIYKRFGWIERYEELRPKFEKYCETLSDFRRNSFASLSPDVKERLMMEWSAVSKDLGYQMEGQRVAFGQVPADPLSSC